MIITTDAGNGGPWEWRPDTVSTIGWLTSFEIGNTELVMLVSYRLMHPSTPVSYRALDFALRHMWSWLGNDRVDIFYRVANPSIWMYYLPDPGTNRVSLAYM